MLPRMKILPILMAASLLAAQAPKAPDFLAAEPRAALPAPLVASLPGLKASALGAHIRFLASPALEGRGLGSRGLEAAGEYAAAQFALAGLAPFGDAPRSYFQAVPLRRFAQSEGSLAVRLPGEKEFRVVPGAQAVFPRRAPETISGPLVFAGYGIQEPAMGRDDFLGLDVNDKIVLLRGGLPPGHAWQTPEWIAKYAAEDREDRYEARLAVLKKLGARVVIAMEEDFPEGPKAARLAFEPFFIGPAEAPPPEGLPLVRLPAKALDPGLPGATATLNLAGAPQAAACRNVLALLPGSDPKLKDEAVVIGAHLDHLGRAGDQVFLGADDNASGVAALLEIAKAFAALDRKPRRSLVFALWTGEEEAKFGSHHYVRHPRWPLAKTTAYLNLDMIGHPWLRDEIRKLVADAKLEGGEAFLAGVKTEDFIEPGVAAGAPWLGPILAQAGQGLGFPLHLDWTHGRNGGSDYKYFARADVPFVRFFGNYFPDYHKIGDTPDRVDPAQALKITRLAFATAWLLAAR
jgi:hypothetical protein